MVENKYNKHLARKAYGERQIDKWVAWSWKNKGKVLWKDLVNKQNEFKNTHNIPNVDLEFENFITFFEERKKILISKFGKILQMKKEKIELE